jgi:hypothetical protein
VIKTTVTTTYPRAPTGPPRAVTSLALDPLQPGHRHTVEAARFEVLRH